MEKRKSGFREWAPHSKAIEIGCGNNCAYCFSAYDAIKRFKRVRSRADWAEPRLNQAAFMKRPVKMDGRIAFPSTHDINPRNVEMCCDYLQRWLQVGNELLIVTKPSYKAMLTMTERLGIYREQIIFRFTIGSNDDEALKFWEPGAPPFEERMDALALAHRRGFSTSVSMEPMLGDELTTMAVVQRVYPHVTDTIWLGMMNKLDSRVERDAKFYEDGGAKWEAIIRDTWKQENVESLYKRVHHSQYKDKVRYKESIQKCLNLPEYEEVG